MRNGFGCEGDVGRLDPARAAVGPHREQHLHPAVAAASSRGTPAAPPTWGPSGRRATGCRTGASACSRVGRVVDVDLRDLGLHRRDVRRAVRRGAAVTACAVVRRGLLAEGGVAATTAAAGEHERERAQAGDETSDAAEHGGEVTGRSRLRCRAWRAGRSSKDVRRSPRQAPEFAPYIEAIGPADPAPVRRPRRTHFAELVAGDLLPAAGRRRRPHDPRPSRGRARRRGHAGSGARAPGRDHAGSRVVGEQVGVDPRPGREGARR